MEREDTKTIIQYLTILELPFDKPITRETLKAQYRKLAHVYHPDTANNVYHDGERFKLFQRAYEYLDRNIEYVNSLIRNGFRENASTERAQPFSQAPKAERPYQPQSPAKSVDRKDEIAMLFADNWNRTKAFHLISSILGGVFAILIFSFGFLKYVSVREWEGGSPVWFDYNLYESVADPYGVYHCAVAFNFVVIGFLLVGLITVILQRTKGGRSMPAAVLRLVESFLTFGLAIPLAVFHLLSGGGGYYDFGREGATVLTVFTWLIIALSLIRTIVAAVPFVKALILLVSRKTR